MTRTLTIAAGVLLLWSVCVEARPRHGTRAPGSVVTSGSDVRITGAGEVIVPPVSIVVVDTTPPGRGQGKAEPRSK